MKVNDKDTNASINTEIDDEDKGMKAKTKDDLVPNLIDDSPSKNAMPLRKLSRWRQAALVINMSRHFRYALDLRKEEQIEKLRRKAGLTFQETSGKSKLDDDTKPIIRFPESENTFDIDAEEDNSIGDDEAHCRRKTSSQKGQNNDTEPAFQFSKHEHSCCIAIEDDNSIGDHEAHDRGIMDCSETTVGSSETGNSYYFSIEEDNSIRNQEAHGRRNTDWSQKVALEWIFVITNFVLEVPSVVLEQLSSAQKPKYAKFSMITSFVALLICIIGLSYEGIKEKVTLRWWGLLPWFYYPSENYIPFGTFKDIIGLVCAFGQTIVSTINYSFCSRHADIPIKVSVWPIIFALGLLCSKCLESSQRRIL